MRISYILIIRIIPLVTAIGLFPQIHIRSMEKVQQELALNGVSSCSRGVTLQGNPTGEAIKDVRITAEDIARLPRGKSYVVDLKRRNTIYHFNPTSRPIDYSRIKVLTTTGEYSIATWLKKRLPISIGSRWKSRPFRVGVMKGGRRHSQPGSSQIQAYINDDGICHCTGNDDCNNMFSDDVCIDEGVCFDDLEEAECFCICAKS